MHPFSSEALCKLSIAGIIDIFRRQVCVRAMHPKKKKSSASGEFGVYIDERLGTRVVWIGSFD